MPKLYLPEKFSKLYLVHRVEFSICFKGRELLKPRQTIQISQNYQGYES